MNRAAAPLGGRTGWYSAAGLLALVLLPLVLNRYHQSVLISAAVAVILGIGFRLLYNAGRFSLGQAAFLGIGAYTSAILTTRFGVNVWFGLALGGLVAAAAAVAFGYIGLRLGGIYFVIVTLALAEGLRHFYIWAEGLTGGNVGVINVPAPSFHLPGMAPFGFGINQLPYYYLILAILIACVLVTHRLERSRIGMAFQCMRQNPLLAQHVGINLTRYRVLAWSTGCFFAGMTGSFLAHYLRYVSPDDFSITRSLYVQVYAIVGGLGSIVGPIVGGAFTVFVSEGLRVSKEMEPAIYGSLLIVTMLVFPNGLITLPHLVRAALAKRRSPAEQLEVSTEPGEPEYGPASSYPNQSTS